MDLSVPVSRFLLKGLQVIGVKPTLIWYDLTFTWLIASVGPHLEWMLILRLITVNVSVVEHFAIHITFHSYEGTQTVFSMHLPHGVGEVSGQCDKDVSIGSFQWRSDHVLLSHHRCLY